MDFQSDATVYTGDGVKIGHIGWVVVDPSTQSVTHIIVTEGFMFDDDKVIPYEAVASADGGRVTLKPGLDPHTFPDYADVDYVPTEIESSSQPPSNRVPVLLSYQSFAGLPVAGLSLPIFLGSGRIPEMRPDTDIDTLPDGAVPLRIGAKVLSSDGIHMGNLERIYAQDGHASHILVSKGVQF